MLAPPSSGDEDVTQPNPLGNRASILISKLAAMQFNKVSAIKEKVRKMGNADSEDVKLKEQAQKR